MASLHGKHGPVFLSANHQVSVLSDISSDSLAHEKAGFFFFFLVNPSAFTKQKFW